MKSKDMNYSPFTKIADRCALFALAAAWIVLPTWATSQEQGQAPQQAPQQTPQQAPPAAPQQPSPEAMQELQQIRATLETVNQKLAIAQQSALEKPEVQSEQAEYEEALTEAMMEKNPEIAEVVEAREALVARLQADPEGQTPEAEWSDEFRQAVEQYRALEQRIAPVRSEAAQAPEVSEKRMELESVLVEEMAKIEPATQELLATRGQLTERFHQLQQQLQQQ